jgi:hypothetical protein
VLSDVTEVVFQTGSGVFMCGMWRHKARVDGSNVRYSFNSCRRQMNLKWCYAHRPAISGPSSWSELCLSDIVSLRSCVPNFRLKDWIITQQEWISVPWYNGMYSQGEYIVAFLNRKWGENTWNAAILITGAHFVKGHSFRTFSVQLCNEYLVLRMPNFV